ncbi:MAG: hypothetical protein WC881_10485 [Elusimicrobiota bacterium]|jgi:hypothetical protein
MIRPDVVAYLQANLKKFPLDDLRQQLTQEGIAPSDFEDSLKAALRAATRPARSLPSRVGLLFLILGAAAIAVGLAAITLKKSPFPPPPASNVVSAAGESAFVGHTGYVIRLPKGYTAVAAFKDQRQDIETVHFCRVGTDPTNFLHEGLFGPLGIVRLEVEPNPFAGSLTGQERLTRSLTARLQAAGNKFSITNIQLSSLRGIQVKVEMTQPFFETYILGDTVLYHFFSGQDDEVYRDIVNSLRDPNAESL